MKIKYLIAVFALVCLVACGNTRSAGEAKQEAQQTQRKPTPRKSAGSEMINVCSLRGEDHSQHRDASLRTGTISVRVLGAGSHDPLPGAVVEAYSPKAFKRQLPKYSKWHLKPGATPSASGKTGPDGRVMLYLQNHINQTFCIQVTHGAAVSLNQKFTVPPSGGYRFQITTGFSSPK